MKKDDRIQKNWNVRRKGAIFSWEIIFPRRRRDREPRACTRRISAANPFLFKVAISSDLPAAEILRVREHGISSTFSVKQKLFYHFRLRNTRSTQ